MSRFNHHGCDKCDIDLPSGWGGYMYVTDESGKRIGCPVPAADTIDLVLGVNASEELFKQRTGFNSDCLCLDCLQKCSLDLNRDDVTCPICKSGRVSSLMDLVGKPCPKCQDGTIRAIFSGAVM